MYNSDMNWPSLVKNKQNNNISFIYIIVAAIVAMSISLWIGMQQSVWFDESYSILVARQEPAEIIRLSSVDVHPPAYYLLLHAWGNALGWGEATLRLSSVLAFGGAIILAGLLMRRLFNDRTAIMVVSVLAFSPLLLRYGFEIRMYALAALIGIAATYVMFLARNAGKGTAAFWLWVSYAVFVAVGVLTLYHLALLWVAHVAWLGYVDRDKLKRFWVLPWVRAIAGAALLFMPWLPTFLKQAGNGALANIGQPMNMEQLIGVLSFNLFYKPLWQVGVIETIVLIAAIAAGAWALIAMFRQKQNRNWLLLLAAYIAVPIILFMVASFLRPVYVERYLSHISIGLMALVGVLFAFSTGRAKVGTRMTAYMLGFAVLVAGVYNLSVVGNFNFQRMQKPAVDEAAQAIDCTGATVVAADPYVATELSYYLPATCDLRFSSEWQSLGGGYAPYSDSPLRLSSVNVPLLTNTLFYVYYDNPKLNIAPEYQQINKRTNGGLTVVQYEAR